MSRRWLLRVAVVAAVIPLAACRHYDPKAPLVGKWTSGVVATEWGNAEITFEFQRESFEFSFDPQEGDTMRTSGKYTLQDNSIVTEELNSGAPMHFTIDGDVLTLTGSDGEVTRLRRK